MPTSDSRTTTSMLFCAVIPSLSRNLQQTETFESGTSGKVILERDRAHMKLAANVLVSPSTPPPDTDPVSPSHTLRLVAVDDVTTSL